MINSNHHFQWTRYFVGSLAFLCLMLSHTVLADAVPHELQDDNHNQQLPTISIIIDDLGYLKKRDTRAIQLPGSVTLAFLPHTPHARELATLAHDLHKEVMLHQPMESTVNSKLGVGALRLNMTHEQFRAQLKSNLESVPFVVGINNHMGSLLTQHPGYMRWLMQDMRSYDNLYFVDSFTTKTSVVQKIALENWVPNVRRNVFLDSDRDPTKIRMHFRRLIKLARKNGYALAIGHPYPETMAILEEELPKLADAGIELLPVSKLLHRNSTRPTIWHASLSH